jgi:hypothetical protein
MNAQTAEKYSYDSAMTNLADRIIQNVGRHRSR